MKASSCTIFLKDEDERLRSFKKMQLNGKANQSHAWKDRLMTFFLKKIKNNWKKKYLMATSMKDESQTPAAD